MFRSVKIRAGALVAAVFAVLLAAGYYGGYSVGRWSIGRALLEGYPALFVLNRPAFGFYEAYRLVNSADESQRLRGYYLLMENRIIDADFFCGRLVSENSEINRRTIVWILGHCSERDRVFSEFSSRYRGSTPAVRREMLRSLQRMGDGHFRKFVDEQHIRGEFLEGL